MLEAPCRKKFLQVTERIAFPKRTLSRATRILIVNYSTLYRWIINPPLSSKGVRSVSTDCTTRGSSLRIRLGSQNR